MPKRLWLYGLIAFLGIAAWFVVRPPAKAPLADLMPQVGELKRSTSVASYSNSAAIVLDRPMLEAADRDPFAANLPSPPPAPRKAAPTPPPVVVAAAPLPAAPALNLRYAGRIISPDGTALVYASQGDLPVTLIAGQTLPNGYLVESITDGAVLFRYVALNTTARLDLPMLPKFETR